MAPRPIYPILADIVAAGMRSDRRFGLGVEEMEPRRVERQAQALLDLGPQRRLDRGGHGVGSDLDIEQDFGTELLNHLDHGVAGQLMTS